MKRLSWKEIQQTYPEQWVGLVNVEYEDNDGVSVKSASVKCIDKTPEELGFLALDRKIEMPIYTTPDHKFQIGALV